MKNNEINDKILSFLSKLTSIIAVFGNKFNDDSFSDFDYTFIIEHNSDMPHIVTVLQKEMAFLGFEEDDPTFFYQKKIRISIYSKRSMVYIIRNLFRSKDNLLSLQGVVRSKVIEACPLYDPDNILQEFQKSLIEYPDDIRDSVFHQGITSLSRILYEWNNVGYRNDFNFLYYISEIIENICIALYSLNRRFFTIPFKQLHSDLTTLKPDISNQLYSIVRGSFSGNDLVVKADSLKSIMDMLKESYHSD